MNRFERREGVKTEFSEVLTELILSHFPDMKDGKANKLVEDILSMTGRLDYRYLHESLCWDHMECLEKLKELEGGK